ncbi:MAG: hypothetical protein CMG33_01975 [Candidatus Marinimicrobia bacterium]|nr:hypothetical protein [Candidatus Neomarinimicrobiota bacterium]
MEYVIAIGLIAVVFGSLLLFAPNSILSLERRANRIYMTDPTFMQYRVPFGIGLFFAALYIIYSLMNESTEYFWVLGVIALIFSVMLLLTPKTIFSLERAANRVYMTDPTFMKYRVPFGIFLLVSGVFMVYASIGYF